MKQILVVFLLALMLCSCSTGEDAPNDASHPSTTLSFTLWGGDPILSRTEQAIRQFEEQNPDLRVRVVTAD